MIYSRPEIAFQYKEYKQSVYDNVIVNFNIFVDFLPLINNCAIIFVDLSHRNDNSSKLTHLL